MTMGSRSMKRYLRTLICSGALWASACASSGVRVAVLRPAEVSLNGRTNVAVGPIQGTAGVEYAQAIKTALGSSEYLTLIDMDSTGIARQQQDMVASDASDGQGPRYGRLKAAAVLVKGRVLEHRYTEQVQRRENTCMRTEGKKLVKYKCINYTRVGQARARVAFDLIDLETSQNLRPKRIQCDQGARESATDAQPAPIDAGMLLQRCVERVSGEFMKAISPWRDYVTLPFRTSGDLPQLESGLQLAKAGQWAQALSFFEQAIAEGESRTDVPVDARAAALLNAGLAHAILHDFETAKKQIRSAHAMTGDDDLLEALTQVERMHRDHEKVQSQVGDRQT